MTPTLVALTPVLDRPQNLEPLARSFKESLAGETVDAAMLFLVNPEDSLEIAELARLDLWFELMPFGNAPGDYIHKMNWGVANTTSDWVLLASDDLRFHHGWFRAALDVHIRTGKLVVGTNDMANPLVKAGKHATHPLIHRDYVKWGTIDNPHVLLHQGYMHNSVDVEFCETAIARGQFAFAPDSRVEHLHPTFNKRVKRDLTYQKGLRFSVRDRQLVQSRRRLWNPQAPKVAPARQRMTVARPSPSSYWPHR